MAGWILTNSNPFRQLLVRFIQKQKPAHTEILSRRTNIKEYERKSFEEQLAELIGSIQSPWYYDDVLLRVRSTRGSELYIEAESDGEEAGIYFVGDTAEADYKDAISQLEQSIAGNEHGH
jgi:hypothetical protein